MTRQPTDRDYWEERARLHGAAAAGYRDAAMDAYEDLLRDRALTWALGAGNGSRLLDAGCGSGRWSVRMARSGWEVVGVDLSRRLIDLATPAANVTYIARGIQDLDLPSASFDAWLSVTALQHITQPAEFDAALRNLTRMTRPGGLAVVLEYSPLWLVGRTAPHLTARSRRQWIAALESAGYTKVRESGVRFAGHVPYMLGIRLLRHRGGDPEGLGWLRSMGWRLDLALARVPGLRLLADVRVLVFKKSVV
jgi:2-polyprenyl-3-methyl-5-hydroxy-6-metoxy-1,4-benzoquinol methylase